MEPKEFFEQTKEALDKTKGDDPVGVDYFIQDIEELIEKWHEEDNHERNF